MLEIVLAFPAEAAATPFNFVALVFPPNGHPPPGVFDKPHFDFHFFLIDSQQRAAIGPSDPSFQAKGAQAPPAASIPPDYVPTQGGVTIPGLGRPWSDPTAPEFQGEPFTASFVYFFFEGRVIHLGPIVTTAFLLTQPDFSAAVKLPAFFAEPGLYPTSYSVRFDATAGEYVIALEGLTAR